MSTSTPTRPRAARLVPPAALLTAGLVLAAPLTASAHVHIDPETATPGQRDLAVAFAVPNESATADTVRVSVALDSSDGVTPTAVRGWRAAVSDAGVTWSATGAGIGEGQTQSFVLTFAEVPDVGRVRLPVTQTYSDGTVARWTQPTPASGQEPEHPAPVLYVRDAPPAEDGDADDDAAEAPVAPAADGTATASLAVGAAGLGIGVVALAVAAVALRRTRRARP